MPRGGKRPGAGRKPSQSRATRVNAAPSVENLTTPPVHPLLALCTAREQQFILALIKDPTNQTKAYESAFKAKGDSARANAAKCLAKDRVRAAYEALSGKVLAEAEDNAIATARERLELVTLMARSGKVAVKDRLKAIDIHNRMDHLYVQKHEHSGMVQVVASPADERL